MKKKISDIIMSICVLILGVSLFFWADLVTNFISIVLGIILILYGLINALAYIKEEKNPIYIIYAIIALIIGIILISRPSIISEIISFIVGLYIILTSISSLLFALNNKNIEKYSIILTLSIIGLIIGLLCLVGKILVPNIILSFIGLLIVIYTIINFINSIMISKNKKEIEWVKK